MIYRRGSAPARAFDKRRFLANVSHVRDVVTPGWITGWKQLSPAQETDALAFIVGFPRSGTTLLDQILDSHPGIQVMEEKPVINELVAEFIDSVGPYPAASVDHER